MKTATIGSISSGTLRSEDLIPALHGELEYQYSPEDREALAGVWNTYNAILDECWGDNGELIESEHDGEIVDDLISALDTFSPPYCYFGAHEGDGADFGYWPSRNAIEDFDGLRVSDLSEVPEDYSGEVLHVNDHGNVSIYDWQAGGVSRALIEIV